MKDEPGEIELRVADAAAPGTMERVEASARALDGSAKVRLDPETGIVHVRTSCDTLDLVAALEKAGLDVTAPTG